MKIENLSVFCGSHSGENPLFTDHAIRLGKILAQKKVTLIYGGGNKGLMGALANSVLENGGKVVGIIPKILVIKERAHTGLTEMYEVEDMHSRKRLLYEKCDAALILPGGYGTMDEFFEMLTWNQLNIHNKKIFILNSDGFYNHLIDFIKKMEAEKFLYHQPINNLSIINSPEDLDI